MIWLYVGGTVGVMGLAIAVWWYRRQATQAQAELERAKADLAAAKTAAANEVERHLDAATASNDFGDRLQGELVALVRRHPELAGEYRGIVVRLASGATGAGVATLPVHGTSGDVGDA